MSQPEPWMLELFRLIHRHPETGVDGDISSMTLDELRGLYNWLRGLEDAHVVL